MIPLDYSWGMQYCWKWRLHLGCLLTVEATKWPSKTNSLQMSQTALSASSLNPLLKRFQQDQFLLQWLFWTLRGTNNTDQTHLINNWNVKFVLSCFVAPKQVEVLIIMLVSTGLWLHACTYRVIARSHTTNTVRAQVWTQHTYTSTEHSELVPS